VRCATPGPCPIWLTRLAAAGGLTTSREAEQARPLVEQIAAQLPPLQTRIEQLRHALAVLAGQPPAACSPQWADRGDGGQPVSA